MVKMEKENKEEPKPEPEPKPEDLGMLENARKIVEEMKAANEERKKLLEKEEKLKAMELLGGKSEAGKEEPEPEISPKEYVKKVMSGEIKGK